MRIIRISVEGGADGTAEQGPSLEGLYTKL